MAIQENEQLTPREHMIMEAEKEERERSREHAVTMKQLEVQLSREKNQAQIELKQLEAKWSTWLKIPILIIKLPILFVFSLGYLLAIARKYDPPKNFWSFLQ